jgi:hypothetical protein
MAKNKKKMNEAIMWLVAALAIAGVAYGVVFLARRTAVKPCGRRAARNVAAKRKNIF